MTQQTNTARFDELGIASNFLTQLTQKGFISPTPIQHQVIPVALEGKDVIGIAQTGTGKTLAFGIPLIQRLAKTKGVGLVIAPTRELALQIDDELLSVGKNLGIKTAVLIGGASSKAQEHKLRQNPHVVISTPGRLMDHLEQRTFSLKNVSMVVLDEADRMLDIGFLPQIKKVLQQVPETTQTLLFSATMPKAIAEIAAKYMKMPLRIEVAPQGTPAAHIEQEVFFADKNTKVQLLEKILQDNAGTVIVFSRTKHGAKRLAGQIREMGHTAIEIHSNRSLGQRKAALEGFKSKRYRVMVATDIAARGIDVSDISLVINFDLPDNSEDYVHRIGRTGRAGKSGKAISFAGFDERHDVKKIEKLIKKTLPIVTIPKDLPPKRSAPKQTYRDDASFDRRGGGGSRGRGGFSRRGSSRSGASRTSSSRQGDTRRSEVKSPHGGFRRAGTATTGNRTQKRRPAPYRTRTA